MSYLILALMVVAAAAVLAKASLGPQGGSIMPTVQLAGGVVLCGLALLLSLGGARWLFFAVPLGAVGLALILNRQRNAPAQIGGGGPSGRYSEVRTVWVDMVLDHNSGAMSGTVLRGPLTGRTLQSLSETEAVSLYLDASGDPQSVQILEAFLDRQFEDWRHAAAGAGGAEEPSSDGPMTREAAFEILGLEPGASDDAVRAAHRELMKKVHPDQGGSTYLATRINAAKDFLLGE